MNKPSEQFSFTFPKKEKLTSKLEIDILFKTGELIKTYPFRILYQISDKNLLLYPKTLISVPKKNHKSAVTRNLVKRRMKEAYRLNKPFYQETLKKLQAIGIIYVSKEVESFDLINDKLILGLQRLSANLTSDNE